MTLNMNTIGKKIGPISKEYYWRDIILYALGVGAEFSNLDYCYEKNFKILPSFSISVIINFISQIVNLPEATLAGILHGEQNLVFHNPMTTEGKLTTYGSITNYYDKRKKKGALVIGKSETYHSNGKKLFTGDCP